MRQRVLLAAQVLAQQHELVAAEARRRVARPQHAAQPLGDRQQELVAGRVARAVVDDLEVVEVEEEHRHERLRARRPGPARGRAGRAAGRGWAAR